MKLDALLGRFSLYRDLRGGTWYGGGVCITPRGVTKIPWKRLSGIVEESTILEIVKREYLKK